METIETLCVALGLATLAGINLYLVVFVTGIAIHFNWVDVSSTYPELMVLGEPAVFLVAAGLLITEILSDKIPWVDSMWDSIHTLIRPAGGALLAIHTLGTTDPSFDVIVGLLAGGTTLMAHTFKAGTRLAVNASPEPFSNVVASVTEDAAVVGGLILMGIHPLLAGALCGLFLVASIYFTPKIFRSVRSFFWLLGKKAFSLLEPGDTGRLYRNSLTSDEDLALSARLGRAPTVAWSIPALVGKTKRFGRFTPNTFGRIVADETTPGALHFIGRKWFRDHHVLLSLDGLAVTSESRFLSEDIVLYDREGRRKLVLRLPSGQRALANRVVEEILHTRPGIDLTKPGGGDIAGSPSSDQAREENAVSALPAAG